MSRSVSYVQLFCNITYTFTSCTENEASRYGRFLCALLQTVMHWHGSRQVFERECAFFPGFVTKFRVSNKQNERSDHVDYENYRHVSFTWFYKITKVVEWGPPLGEGGEVWDVSECQAWCTDLCVNWTLAYIWITMG